ncbi:MAG: aldolase/citrate lyase family protein [Thaumarchaeota archaeon]|nr:aldolase/citrate lyase family protein [Nitrososphaerota archaeon]
MKNRLKRMLKQGKLAIGTELTIAHPDIAEAIGRLGYDWVMIDTEHAPLDPGMVQNLLQAMSASKSVPIARVTWNNMVLIKRLLDIGMYGIIVPWVNTGEEATMAVRSMRYPPLGVRGYGPRRAAMGDPDYVRTANRELFLGVQIETQRAVDNIDEILSVEGVDAALIGPADLSLSMGILGQFDDGRFVGALEKVIESCRAHGVTPGMLGTDDVGKRARQGFRMFCRRNDISHIREGAEQSLAESRQAVASNR